jgi:DNA polymerase (family 10)
LPQVNNTFDRNRYQFNILPQGLADMPVRNSDVANLFNTMADLLDIQGENPFRIRAYRNAARIVSNLPRNVKDMVEEGKDLTELPGIGDDLASKIEEIVRTGTLLQLKKLEKRIPPELREMMRLSGLGPRRVRMLRLELGVKSLDDLEEAAKAGQIRKLARFGEKTEQKILDEIKRLRQRKWQDRVKLVSAEQVAETLLEYLCKANGVKQITVAGSYRRKCDTVGDLDILITAKSGSDAMDRFVGYEDVKEVVSKGSTRSTVILRSGFQVDLRVVPEVSYGAALYYFTGSKDHNIAVRKIAVGKGLKINEYGVFKGDDRLAGATEEEVFKQVDLPYIVPELRENRGEIEAARDGKLPELVTLDDIKGDLQSHTDATDGHYTLKEMAEAAKRKGYQYLAITDHSKRVTMAKGLDEKRLAQQIAQIDKLNGKMTDFRILKSVEVDILKDGTLDLSNDILKEMDLVICATHYYGNLPSEQQTRRILKAMDNPYFNILAHPTGRIIGRRDPYEMDMEKILRAAKERGCFLEINAQPDRLDLSDIHAKMAKDIGVKLAISTDAHTIADLDNMKYGINQARRGWLEKDDVLNTRNWSELGEILKR